MAMNEDRESRAHRLEAGLVLDDDGEVFVREWHAIECHQFIELTSDVRHEHLRAD